MPSSWVKWAVDFDGDGRIDLTRSTADVIGSVANYFKGYGWQPGMPTHYPVSFDNAKLDKEALLAPDILPTFSVDELHGQGRDARRRRHWNTRARWRWSSCRTAMPNLNYVAGTENFYVITRYNWSSYYAMAVIELGREVKQALATSQSAAAPARPGE